MPKSDRTTRVPKNCHHKSTNRAFVKLDGKFHYLGRYGTEDNRSAYERFIARWLQNGRSLPEDSVSALSIEELLIAYYRFAVDYYTDPSTGKKSTELDGIRIALGVVRRLFAGTKAADFGPLEGVPHRAGQRSLRAQEREPLRSSVRRAFRWGVENELIPPSVLEGLNAVPGLRRGRCKAPEGTIVPPAKRLHVEAAMQHMTTPVRGLVEFQLLTGCRPGEAT